MLVAVGGGFVVDPYAPPWFRVVVCFSSCRTTSSRNQTLLERQLNLQSLANLKV